MTPPDDNTKPPEMGTVPLAPDELKTNIGSGTVPSGPRPAGAPSFSSGEMVSGAGRFRIVQFIAKGGMGEVFEAEDQELHETVALKTVRPDIAADPHAMDRFKREIQLARKITHPNVCRIYDLFSHTRPDGSPVYFLTMELLIGETLEKRLKRGGRMTAAEAYPIARQMAMGMTAAHRAGIVHRDFKSANVMLVAAPEMPGGMRAVVTDFGLAQSTTAGVDIHDTIGSIVGSPAYMAPEQVQGREATASVDIYAFGIVLYEMVTGSTPFKGETAMAVAMKRLKELPPSPRRFAPELDPNWETAILQCLEVEPGHRYATMIDVAKALTLTAAPSQPSGPPPPPVTAFAPPPPQPGTATRAMVCPRCYRQLGTMTRCPACNIDASAEQTQGPDSDEAFIRSIQKRKLKTRRKSITGKIIGFSLPLLLLAGFVGALCWPVPAPPVGQPLGPASRKLVTGAWEQFQDDVKFHKLAHFEITDGQLTSLLQDNPESARTLISFTDGTHLHMPVKFHGLTLTVRIQMSPVYEKEQVQLNVEAASIGVVPMPLGKVEEKLDESFTPQLESLLAGVTTAKIEKGKLTLDHIPKTVAPGQVGAEGWRLIQ